MGLISDNLSCNNSSWRICWPLKGPMMWRDKMRGSVLMAADMISVFSTPVLSVMRDVEGVAGCRSKSDASVTFGVQKSD